MWIKIKRKILTYINAKVRNKKKIYAGGVFDYNQNSTGTFLASNKTLFPFGFLKSFYINKPLSDQGQCHVANRIGKR